MKKNYLLLTLSPILLVILGFMSACDWANEPSQDTMQRGKKLYALNCQTCHGAQGEGMPSVFPPLAQADYLMSDRNRAIKQVLYGARGTIVVNGKTYTGEMPAQGLNDQQTADVLNYVRNSWGNKDNIILQASDIKAQRR